MPLRSYPVQAGQRPLCPRSGPSALRCLCDPHLGQPWGPVPMRHRHMLRVQESRWPVRLFSPCRRRLLCRGCRMRPSGRRRVPAGWCPSYSRGQASCWFQWSVCLSRASTSRSFLHPLHWYPDCRRLDQAASSQVPGACQLRSSLPACASRRVPHSFLHLAPPHPACLSCRTLSPSCPTRKLLQTADCCLELTELG